MKKQETQTKQETAQRLDYRIIGEAFNSYVLVESEDRLLIIDKHAAHERILFEQLKAAMREHNERSSQMLLLPIEIMMTSDEIQTLVDYQKEIEAMGFDYTTGAYTVFVSAIPTGIDTD